MAEATICMECGAVVEDWTDPPACPDSMDQRHGPLRVIAGVVSEARVAELGEAADEIVAALNEWMADTEADDQRLEAALARYQAVRKGDEAK